MTNQSASEDRYRRTVGRLYRNDQIEITWEPGRCIHFAACVRGSVQAFNPQRRPWIDVAAESPERLAEIVARCPTSALRARRADGWPAEATPDITTITPMLDGPLFVRGPLRIRDRQGNFVREETRAALCRCGHSKNKPFCDDSHYRSGFRSNDPAFGEEPDDPDTLVR